MRGVEGMDLSPNLQKVKPSITMAVGAKASEMKARGIDVITMSAGEPDFDTPEHIRKAAIDAINAGYTRYTPVTGSPDLKQAVREKFRRDDGLQYEPPQVIVSCGAKHSIFLAVFVLTAPGDEVIIPAPYWVSYPEMVNLAGGTPVIVDCHADNSMKMTADQLKKAITPRTKLLILNSPSNPTGMVYTGDELRELAAVIEEAGIYVISDEIYQHLVYGGVKNHSLAAQSKALYDHTISVNGVSKTYCMTGWRIGYAAGPAAVIKGMSTVQSQETSNPSSISQKAALAALTGPKDFLPPMIEEYDRRRKYITGRLNGMDGVECLVPDGAFYVFPDVSGYYGRSYGGGTIDGSVAFCNYMLEEEHLALVPGGGFGADNHVRLSYAVSMQNIEKALDRLEHGLKRLG